MQSLCDVQHPRRVDATDHRSPYSDLNGQVMPRTSGTESETGTSSATLPCLSNSHTHLHTHICTHVCREGELTTCSFTPRAGVGGCTIRAQQKRHSLPLDHTAHAFWKHAGRETARQHFPKHLPPHRVPQAVSKQQCLN